MLLSTGKEDEQIEDLKPLLAWIKDQKEIAMSRVDNEVSLNHIGYGCMNSDRREQFEERERENEHALAHVTGRNTPTQRNNTKRERDKGATETVAPEDPNTLEQPIKTGLDTVKPREACSSHKNKNKR